jgi:hypothetical protein
VLTKQLPRELIRIFHIYFDGILKYFIVFVKENLQKNKTYSVNILVQIIAKKYKILIGEILKIFVKI